MGSETGIENIPEAFGNLRTQVALMLSTLCFAIIGCQNLYPTFPDGASILRPGMTISDVRLAMGAEGVLRHLPPDASYKEAIEFDGPPRYPTLNIYVAFSAWTGRDGEALWWTISKRRENANGGSIKTFASIPTTSPATTTPSGPLECDENEYAVFAAVIKHCYGDKKVAVPHGLAAKPGLTVDQFAIAVHTRVFGMRNESFLGAPHLLSKAQGELEAAFADVNQQPARIDPKRIAVKGMEIVPIEQYNYEDVDRPNHSQKFPRTQGLSLFSRVAFSKDGRRACVNSDTSEGQFGYGMIFYLECDQTGWHVKESNLSWIN